MKADARYHAAGSFYVQHAPHANNVATCSYGCGMAITRGSLRVGVVEEFKQVQLGSSIKAESPVKTRLYFAWAHLDCMSNLDADMPSSIRQFPGYDRLDAASKVRCILAAKERPEEFELEAAK